MLSMRGDEPPDCGSARGATEARQSAVGSSVGLHQLTQTVPAHPEGHVGGGVSTPLALPDSHHPPALAGTHSGGLRGG